LVVCLGSELGSETSGQYRLRLPERVIQVDASPERIAATYAAHAVIGDLKRVLGDLLEGPLPARASGGADRAARARSELERALRPPGRIEPDLLDAIAGALPNGATHAWDMTIMGYWAASALPVRAPREFLYPLGSGTLGYAFPAALGAAIASGRPSLAVAGDGGISYGLQELAAAKQHDLPTTLLIVDDGGYGVLREYQGRAYGRTFAVDLQRPDFVALAAAFGIPARPTAPGTIAADLREALAAPGPSALILPARLASPPSFE
jgi:acetolactate synthase-1/2/3 large subunit